MLPFLSSFAAFCGNLSSLFQKGEAWAPEKIMNPKLSILKDQALDCLRIENPTLCFVCFIFYLHVAHFPFYLTLQFVRLVMTLFLWLIFKLKTFIFLVLAIFVPWHQPSPKNSELLHNISRLTSDIGEKRKQTEPWVICWFYISTMQCFFAKLRTHQHGLCCKWLCPIDMRFYGV